MASGMAIFFMSASLGNTDGLLAISGLTNKVFYANPNKESKKFIKPEIASNPSVFPSDADMKKMAMPDAINNDLRRTMTRLYTSFKTGL